MKGGGMVLRALNDNDLEMLSGGTIDDAYELGLELCKQYGVPDEDFDALFKVISDDDHRRLFDALSKPE